MARKVANAYNDTGRGNIRLLEGVLATRLPIISQLEKAPDLVIYMGHGQADRICGESPMCDAIGVEDAYLFKDKIVVCAPACEVGQVLGPIAIRNGAKAFIGATTSMYGAWQELDHDYYSDWRVYFETLYKSLLTKSVGDSLQAYKDKASEFIELYKKNERLWPNADWYINATYVNRDRLEAFGSKDAKIRPIPRQEMQQVKESIDVILDWFAPPL
jgi:hypothetical protein